MQSKSKACVVTSLSVSFLVMLLLAIGAHALLHPYESGAEKSLMFPGTDFSGVTVMVWGLVAAAGAGVKSAASYILTHHR